MTQAKRDQNHVTTALGVSSSDSVTTLPLRVDPATNYLLVFASEEAITPVALTANKRDDNFVPTYYGVSSVDGETLIPIRTDTNGKLLTKTD